MDFCIEKWIAGYIGAVKNVFGNRIWFAGLQGSYARGEATCASDIDVVLILHSLFYEDLNAYDDLLDTLPHREKVCGFISGRAELQAWEKSDLFQFCHDTTPLLGSLDALMQTVDADDVRRAIKIGACNIYHACAHNALHEKSADALRGLYKSAAFTLQAIAYLHSGVFEKRQEALLPLLLPADRAVLEKRLSLKKDAPVGDDAFAELSKLLLERASAWIINS